MQVMAGRVVAAVGLGLMLAATARAQPAVAHITYLENGVFGRIARLHKSAPASSFISAPILDGDQIHTATHRAEITFTDGAVVLIDHDTRVAVFADARVQLLDGRLFVRTAGRAFQLDSPGGRAQLLPRGSYGITSKESTRNLAVQVVAGEARVESQWGPETVGFLQTAIVAGPTSRPFVGPTQSAGEIDAFERWAATRSLYAAHPAEGGLPATAMDTAAPTYYGGRHGYRGPSYYSYYAPSYSAPAYSPYSYSRPYYDSYAYPSPYYYAPYSAYSPFIYPYYMGYGYYGYTWRNDRIDAGRGPDRGFGGFDRPTARPLPSPAPAPAASPRPRGARAGVPVRPPS